MKKKVLFISIGTVLILFLITMAVWAISVIYSCTKANTSIRFDENAAEWNGESSSTQQGTEEIKIPGYGTVYFPQDSTSVPITLYNPADNTCCFEFVLYINDKSEAIYTSDYVEPGSAIKEIQLSEPLKKGEYNLKIKVNTYDTETKTQLNNAVVKTDLVVQ